MAEFAQDVRHLTHHQQDVANVMRDLLLGLGGAASFLIGRRALRRTLESKHP
jgi:hypothetical protein